MEKVTIEHIFKKKTYKLVFSYEKIKPKTKIFGRTKFFISIKDFRFINNKEIYKKSELYENILKNINKIKRKIKQKALQKSYYTNKTMKCKCIKCGKEKHKRNFLNKKKQICLKCEASKLFKKEEPLKLGHEYIKLLENNLKEAKKEGMTSFYHGARNFMSTHKVYV